MTYYALGRESVLTITPAKGRANHSGAGPHRTTRIFSRLFIDAINYPNSKSPQFQNEESPAPENYQYKKALAPFGTFLARRLVNDRSHSRTAFIGREWMPAMGPRRTAW